MELSDETLAEVTTIHQYLPAGALGSIRRDARTSVNCISLAEAIACTQSILRRSCIHVDNLEAFQIGSSIFDVCFASSSVSKFGYAIIMGAIILSLFFTPQSLLPFSPLAKFLVYLLRL